MPAPNPAKGETTTMNPNHNRARAHQRPGLRRRAARRWANTLARLAEAGREHGADDAAW